MTTSDIRFSREGSLGLITLEREKALNALTTDMCAAMHAQLKAWAEDPRVFAVAIEGAGKAFCAGGDVRTIAESAKDDPEGRGAREFFQTEYALNTAIKNYPKPYIALIDGVCMGGGVGVSIHGAYQIVTERALWAMPENAIGMIPDVGSSWALPRLGKGVGRYLAMTGARLKQADCLRFKVASHAVSAAALDELKAAIAALSATADPLELEVTLDKFNELPGEPGLSAADKDAIQTVFNHADAGDIVGALKTADGAWAEAARKAIADACPFILEAAIALQNRGAILPFEQAIAMEFRAVNRVVKRADFHEGVRAVLIDKSKDAAWDPSSLARVDAREVEALFDPDPVGELVLG